VFAFAMGFAANGAIFAGNVAQHELGWAGWQIGLSIAAQALGIALAAPLLWLLSRARRPVDLPAFAAFVATLGFLAVAIDQHWMLAALARFIFGCGIGLGVAHAEYIAIARVRSDIRPVMAGLFGLAIGAGHLLGTLLIECLGLWCIRLLVCGLIAATAFLMRQRGEAQPIHMFASVGGILRLIKQMPVLFAAPLLFGFLDNGFLAMLPGYGLELGLPASQVKAMSFAAFAGILTLQLPAALLCTRFDAAAILRASVIATVATVIALSLAISVPGLRLILAFVLGGIIDVFYTVGLIAIANRLPNRQLIIGNACFVSLCGVGEVAGPMFSGQFMSWFGPSALFGVVALLLSLYWFGAALWRESETPAGHDRRAVEERRTMAATPRSALLLKVEHAAPLPPILARAEKVTGVN
jgi:MFS family permease